MKRVLVLGGGSIGERHARCLLNTGRTAVGLCEPRESVRAALAERYSLCGTFATLPEALAQDWDAAVICAPAPLHVPLALELGRRGIHLLIEKPLSLSLAGIAELQALVQEKKLVVAIGYVLRAEPSLGAMRSAIASGRFCKPLELLVVGGQHFPTFRPAYREIYYADRAQGGGVIQDAITHYFDAGQWLVGQMDRLVVDAAHCRLEGVEVEDTVHVLARHGDVLAGYAVNQYQAPNELTITVICKEGTARYEAHAQRWRWKTQPDGSPAAEPWHDEPGPQTDRDGWFIRQEAAFLDALSGAAPLCPLADGVAALRVQLAALRSLAEGTWQRVERD